MFVGGGDDAAYRDEFAQPAEHGTGDQAGEKAEPKRQMQVQHEPGGTDAADHGELAGAETQHL